MNEGKIARINALYHKSKSVGLTDEEKEEQKKLRKEYIEAIRGNMRATLDHTSIQNEDGTLTPLRIVRQQNLAKKVEDNVGLINNDIDNVENINELKQKRVDDLKKTIRKNLSEKRNNMSEHEVNQRSGIICNKVINSSYYKEASAVCVYEAFRNEVDCTDITLSAYEDDKKVFVPVVDTTSKKMSFYEINESTVWIENEYGIKEPDINNDSVKLEDVASDNILIIMPGLAFDRNRHRIGYGGGYYDQYLNDNKTDKITTMAVCYSFQIVEDNLPYNEHDIAPDFIMTENGLI